MADDEISVADSNGSLTIPMHRRAFVGLYYTNWSIYSKNPNASNLYPSSLALKEVSHIFYAFFSINDETGSIVSNDPYADFQIERDFLFQHKKMKARGLIEEFNKCKSQSGFKLIMSVGGWGRGHLFSLIAKSPTKIKLFVDSAIDIMLKYDFDGIDIDWEYPNSQVESANLINLLKCLRRETRAYSNGERPIQKSLIISMASPAGWEQLECLDLNKIDRYLHFWNVMTYDFSGEWCDVVGHHSNLYDPVEKIRFAPCEAIVFTEDCNEDSNEFSIPNSCEISDVEDSKPLSCALVIKYYTDSGIKRKKLMLGMPNYGRIFYDTKGYGYEFGSPRGQEFPAGVIGLNEIPGNYTGMIFNHIPIEGASYFYSSASKIFISFDNIDVVKAKIRFCVSEGLGGGFFWEASGDYPHNSDMSHLVFFSQNLEHYLQQSQGQ